ncbi:MULTISPECIES: SRPBCC family protein [Actinomadura]|uniref:SRPBCC family protein n=1 Tax=Actinomadura yumaensis TaxID=111807 RepID=A0ABW2CMV2_9ACTN|nr:SRPBCC family protein [Actinomadura sp. J1-007]MWK32842.1 SRPBCC family protein [Actinomadura sp. J1-007]
MRFRDPISGTITIDVDPDRAYGVLCDPPRMAEFAEETVAADWLGGATRAAVGARFRGANRHGRRLWYTRCRVTDADPDRRRFAYEVATPFKVPICRWQYEVEDAPDGGCVVTETCWIRAPVWFIPFAILITGVLDRPGANKAHIATTLARLKAHLEAA